MSVLIETCYYCLVFIVGWYLDEILRYVRNEIREIRKIIKGKK